MMMSLCSGSKTPLFLRAMKVVKKSEIKPAKSEAMIEQIKGEIEMRPVC